MEPFGYPMDQIAGLALILTMILGIAALFRRRILFLGIWIVRLIGAVAGTTIMISIWIVGEGIQAIRTNKQNGSE